MIVIQTLVLVLVAISRPDNMQLDELIKAATPLSALNSVRDFSASGHTSANFKNKYWVGYKKHLS